MLGCQVVSRLVLFHSTNWENTCGTRLKDILENTNLLDRV